MSLSPQVSLHFCRNPRCDHTIVLTSTPVAALILSGLFFPIPLPSNLPFLVFLPLFSDYRVTVAVAQPERRKRAGTRRPRRPRAEGARGTCRPRRASERSTPSPLFPPPLCRQREGSAPATPSPSPPRRGSEGSTLFAPSTSPPRRQSSPLPPSPGPRATP